VIWTIATGVPLTGGPVICPNLAKTAERIRGRDWSKDSQGPNEHCVRWGSRSSTVGERSGVDAANCTVYSPW